jgi:signal transduction histidine kinase
VEDNRGAGPVASQIEESGWGERPSQNLTGAVHPGGIAGILYFCRRNPLGAARRSVVAAVLCGYTWEMDDRPRGAARAKDLAPGLRPALLVGFGVTVAIWLFVGYDFSVRIAEVDDRAADVSRRYLSAQDLLSEARGQTLLASVSVRDALLDAGRPPARDYARELDGAYAIAERALAQYVPVLDSSAEQARIQDLRSQVTGLRDATTQVLAATGPRLPSDAGRVLRTKIVPRRDAVISVADELQALNRHAFVQHQAEVANIHARAQGRIWQALALALAASLAVGLLAARHAGRLEERIRRQRARELKDKEVLHQLSASLLTAQEEERRVISRELHDEIGQVLTAIKVELAVAQRTIDGAGGPSGVLDDVRGIADRAMHSVRDLSHLLHPPQLDDLGLPEALEWFLKGFRRRHGLRVDLQHAPPVGELPRDLAVAVYRIVQEALTNVAKHARASRCRVEVGQGLDALVVAIDDNGVGFDTAALDRAGGAAGLGLVGIRERVQQFAGRMRLVSSPGIGTRLTVALPHPAPATSTSGFGGPDTGPPDEGTGETSISHAGRTDFWPAEPKPDHP